MSLTETEETRDALVAMIAALDEALATEGLGEMRSRRLRSVRDTALSLVEETNPDVIVRALRGKLQKLDGRYTHNVFVPDVPPEWEKRILGEMVKPGPVWAPGAALPLPIAERVYAAAVTVRRMLNAMRKRSGSPPTIAQRFRELVAFQHPQGKATMRELRETYREARAQLKVGVTSMELDTVRTLLGAFGAVTDMRVRGIYSAQFSTSLKATWTWSPERMATRTRTHRVAIPKDELKRRKDELRSFLEEVVRRIEAKEDTVEAMNNARSTEFVRYFRLTHGLPTQSADAVARSLGLRPSIRHFDGALFHRWELPTLPPPAPTAQPTPPHSAPRAIDIAQRLEDIRRRRGERGDGSP